MKHSTKRVTNANQRKVKYCNVEFKAMCVMEDHSQIKVDMSVRRHNVKDKFILSKLANACRSVVECSVGFKGRRNKLKKCLFCRQEE
mmetsp:Transcript_29796/g.45173  ORF Transcript_29796/g.45173 Transcript_29796/m.45173 type:complete len:87 (-) Transcript_29796:1105-1365(-)